MVRYSALEGFYEVKKTIGCGGFAKVKLAVHIATGEKVAIKIMEKSCLGDDLPRVALELKALKTLSHEHICKLYQVIETDTHYFIIVEYCAGGELFDHIVEKNKLSEADSRKFFRQIVSAVAYLHCLGYAHRDLKPENVLLDKDQSLKLIDFGLCARPKGGMKSPLFTSCGSPTYAAPELVMGKQYLGPEVDVWAMGVLLYALLAGFLPFDDQNIDSLYKKILSGRYEEPSFMSDGSKNLIRSMLQVEPKKRITVKELLSHPWITMGVLDPVEVKSEPTKCLDEDCVTLMAQYHKISPGEMWRHLRRWRYDYNTATYFLLLARKKKGAPMRLNAAANKLSVKVRMAGTPIAVPKPPTTNFRRPRNENVPNANGTSVPTKIVVKIDVAGTPDGSKTRKNEDIENLQPITPKTEEFLSPSTEFLEPRRPLSIRKPQKRIRSPNLDGDCSPIPAKKVTPSRPPTPCTPERKRTSSESTPGSARRMLGSIERSLHRVRHVLTPKRPATDQNLQPVILANKDLCNVSTTQCSDPEYVITELSKGLQKKGIQCERKGFRLRGKMEPTTRFRYGGCSFELEICYLPSLAPVVKTPNDHVGSNGNTPTKSILKNGTANFGTQAFDNLINSEGNGQKNGAGNSVLCSNFLVPFVSMPPNRIGIRRKRLKGDSWCYKKVCEEVLALTATDLKSAVESSV